LTADRSRALGLVLATVGFDIITGEPRLQFGDPLDFFPATRDWIDTTGFSHGIRFLVLAIGVYGIGEMLWTISSTRGEVKMTEANINFSSVMAAIRQFPKAFKGTTIGSFLGFFVGILPAAGATPGSLMAYGVTKMMSKNKESYGRGNLNGIAAPEAANNSASTGAMLPMMTLGIPGSPTTAVLLAGMVIWGLQPGPLLFSEQPEFVWPLIGSFYISNFIALIINLAFIPLFLWMLRMPFTILAPMILMLIFGIFAYILRILDYPLAPAVLAIVLGPIAEPTLRQSLLLSDGSFSIFFNRPIAGPITIIALILLFLPLLRLVAGLRRREATF